MCNAQPLCELHFNQLAAALSSHRRPETVGGASHPSITQNHAPLAQPSGISPRPGNSVQEFGNYSEKNNISIGSANREICIPLGNTLVRSTEGADFRAEQSARIYAVPGIDSILESNGGTENKVHLQLEALPQMGEFFAGAVFGDDRSSGYGSPSPSSPANQSATQPTQNFSQVVGSSSE